MKTLLGLVIALCFIPRCFAGPIHFTNPKITFDSNLSSDIKSILAEESASQDSHTMAFKAHCNVIDVQGYSPCGAVASIHPTFIHAAMPQVTGTPEPASLLLFGTVLLGAFAITKFRS
jgi:PEP-CTERM motif